MIASLALAFLVLAPQGQVSAQQPPDKDRASADLEQLLKDLPADIRVDRVKAAGGAEFIQFVVPDDHPQRDNIRARFLGATQPRIANTDCQSSHGGGAQPISLSTTTTFNTITWTGNCIAGRSAFATAEIFGGGIGGGGARYINPFAGTSQTITIPWSCISICTVFQTANPPSSLWYVNQMFNVHPFGFVQWFPGTPYCSPF